MRWRRDRAPHQNRSSAALDSKAADSAVAAAAVAFVAFGDLHSCTPPRLALGRIIIFDLTRTDIGAKSASNQY